MSDREQLFSRALAGELAWDSEELERLRRESPEVARELDELFVLQGLLDAREVVGLHETPSDEDLALVAGVVSKLPEGSEAASPILTGPGPRMVGEVPRWMQLAAAVLLVTLGGWWWSAGGGEPGGQESGREDVRLGRQVELEALEPVGEVDEWSGFRVAGDLSGMVYCEIRIWDDDAAPGTEPLEIDLTEAGWTPSEAERSDLPRRIRWRLTAYGRRGSQDIVGRTDVIEAVLP